MTSRRAFIAAMAAVAGATALPIAARSRALPLRKPPRLKAGDVVGLVEPASAMDDPYDITLVEDTIRAMGLVPKRGAHIGQRYGYLAGDDAARAADINAMYADSEVKAVFAVRGGWAARGCCPISIMR